MRDEDEEVLAIAHRVAPGASGWIRADCPFCLLLVGKEDRTQALGVNARTGWWRCFRCETHGRIPAEELLFGLPPLEEVSELAPPEPPPEMDLPNGFTLLADGAGATASVLAGAREYLERRRIPRETWRAAGLGAVPFGFWAGRIIVPVRRADGTLAGWAARAFDGNALRYLYPRGMDRGSALFNEAALYVETNEPAIVVEGTFDAMPLWPEAVAVLGKPSRAHVALLKKARRPLAIVLDGDAWREAEALAMRLRYVEKMRAGFVRLPATKDPDDCRDDVPRLARECVA